MIPTDRSHRCRSIWRYMGNCNSHGGNLLAAAVNGDEDAVLKVGMYQA